MLVVNINCTDKNNETNRFYAGFHAIFNNEEMNKQIYMRHAKYLYIGNMILFYENQLNNIGTDEIM